MPEDIRPRYSSDDKRRLRHWFDCFRHWFNCRPDDECASFAARYGPWILCVGGPGILLLTAATGHNWDAFFSMLLIAGFVLACALLTDVGRP